MLDFTAQHRFQCSDREEKELRVYRVLGWVRRIKKHEADGDWHFELTQRADTPTDSCIVAEIPPEEFSGNYVNARADLDQILQDAGITLDSRGDLSQPIRVRVIGAAFFDGQHRGREGRRHLTDGNHGRCNSSARALWELHPVYWVLEP